MIVAQLRGVSFEWQGDIAVVTSTGSSLIDVLSDVSRAAGFRDSAEYLEALETKWRSVYARLRRYEPETAQ
jgi:hypothetical protein